MEHYICTTCGTQYPASQTPPERCPICEDERQYVNPAGQQWTTLAELRGRHRNVFTDVAPGITAIATEPQFAIGERAYLLQTPAGNVLWDCITYLDDATIAEIQGHGGLAAIAISHPHFYSTMAEWSRAFGGVPIYLHADNRPWVMRPDPAIRFFEEETREILPGVTVIRCGGHFPGSAVLHWRDAHDGAGAIFTGDTIRVVADARYVTFMYSYPNLIPLGAPAVRRIVAAVEPYAFAHLHDMYKSLAAGDPRAAIRRSAERYLAHIGES